MKIGLRKTVLSPLERVHIVSLQIFTRLGGAVFKILYSFRQDRECLLERKGRFCYCVVHFFDFCVLTMKMSYTENSCLPEMISTTS